MAKLEILHFPDPRLRKKAVGVKNVDKSVQKIVDDMFETMYQEQGIGLAATQVNIHKKIIVIDISEPRNEKLVLINPEITYKEGEEEMEEGCLSVPGFSGTIQRAEKITVKALDYNGKEFVLDADGLLSVCIQHEMDHLQGKLFVDYLSSLRKQLIKKKLIKQKKDGTISTRNKMPEYKTQTL